MRTLRTRSPVYTRFRTRDCLSGLHTVSIRWGTALLSRPSPTCHTHATRTHTRDTHAQGRERRVTGCKYVHAGRAGGVPTKWYEMRTVHAEQRADCLQRERKRKPIKSNLHHRCGQSQEEGCRPTAEPKRTQAPSRATDGCSGVSTAS